MINIDALRARAGIIRRIRAFFDNLGFLEVETPVRIAAPAPEEYIDCPPVAGGGFLRASPELQMKKLLAAGMERIYQIGPCFREGESGERHSPEFTMLEWYRRDASYLDIADDLERLLAELSGGAIGGVKRLKVREAYLKYAGWDPWENWDRDRFDFDMAVKIEPALKELGGGVFLTDYPREAASLAVTRGDHAERWEFYLDGVELANCFTELCDREEQKARFMRAKELRKTLGESDYPIDFEFLDIVADMGSPAGVALGVDRLVMRLTGADSISAVRAPE
jgi:lysyl-tRNA synthetase class 2